MEELSIIHNRYKSRYLFLIVITLFAAAFFLRLYASTTVPLTGDEEEKAKFARQISFSPNNLNLPVGTRLISAPTLSVYIVKLGFSIFGESKFGGRFFFVVLGTLSLYFIYKLVSGMLGIETGFLTLFFLAFSQFHISSTRLIENDGLSLFFASLIIYCFFKSLRTERKKWVYFTGIFLGIGFNAKVIILLLVPVFLIYILSTKKYRIWLKHKDTYLALFLMLILIAPYMWWSLRNYFNILSPRHLGKIGISLRALYLYFGEVFVWVAQRYNNFVWDLSKNETILIKSPAGILHKFSTISPEQPVIHWVMGILIFVSILYCLRRCNRKNELIRFSYIMFIFIFMAVSILAGRVSLFDKHVWAIVTLYPGVIMCSYMLIRLKERYVFVNFSIAALIIYFIIHSLYFVNIPENMFTVPKNVMCGYCLDRAELYLAQGKSEEAVARCKWVIGRDPSEGILNRAENILKNANQITASN